ncbi:M12 family metallo-peptidase [Prosthecomicrobium sp. N25]|uniref:M12 family metallo-peptidase n=1 Tax=Prosthecomicrobium sp. N25 TaxID=3129254 RepID=UPI003076E8FE
MVLRARCQLLAFVFVAGALLAPASAGAADGLLQPARGEAGVTRSKSIVPNARRHRIVEVDASALAATVAPLGMDNDPRRAEKVPPASATVAIELFPDLAVTLEREAVEAAPTGGFAWTGRAKGRRTAFASLVVKDGRITGVVETDGRIFRIDPVPNSANHQVTELDPASYKRDLHRDLPGSADDMGRKKKKPKPAKPGTTTPPTTTPPTTSTNTDIKVLIAYTPQAAAKVSDIQAQAQLAITLANAAFQRSGVKITYTLVGTVAASSYNETAGSYGDVLDDLTGGASGLANVATQRNALQADLVSLLVARNEYCGVAWVVPDPDSGSAAWGTSVVSVDCVSNNTFSHETGHNMGLYHDRYVESSAPNSVYNFGYVDVTARFRDIMSYPDKCSASRVTCTRIPYFSTPLVNYNGVPVGIPQGSAGAADGVRKLNENATGIAGYR